MTEKTTEPASDFVGLAGRFGQSGNRKRIVAVAAMATAVLIVGIVIYLLVGNDGDSRFKTAEAARGDLTVLVTATGVLEPVTQVEVGTEISGTVESVEVDYNDRVKVGQVLARLDTDQLEARARQSQAALNLARAKVDEAQATVEETKKRRDRMQQLALKNLCSKEECDAAEAAYARAVAALASARAQVTQARAQLDSDRTALKKAVIVSPINGMVLQRQIEPGQTVAASLQTPVLFVLAENLAQMELHVAVDEADVGQVREQQPATFTVDAYPDRDFPAVITQVRSAPKTVEGVVTYETVLSVDNSDLLLRPGMTATADITVRKLANVLLVPNTALRFTPPTPAETGEGDRSLVRQLLPHRPHREKQKAEPAIKGQQRVWTLRDGVPVAIPVTVGATDGKMTEVVSGDVAPGLPLLVDTVSPAK